MSTDPAEAVPRRRGRPRALEPRSSVTVRVTAAQHDQIIAAAKAQNVGASTLMRRLVIQQIGRR